MRRFLGLGYAKFAELHDAMYGIGFDFSASRADYGKATCLNCRAIVRIGVPEMMGLYHAKQHRQVCGSQNLTDYQRQGLEERLAAIPDWWKQ
jgi:hypothetical protein